MPYEQLTEQQVADYIHLSVREVTKLASRGHIPCRKIGRRFEFLKGDVDHWVESHMHTLGKKRLAGIERGVSAHHGLENDQLLVCSLIPDGGVAVPLPARTRQAALKTLVDLADQAGLVFARQDLLAEVRSREELCSTALWPGVALPHPRYPLPYDIAASFVVVGLTDKGVPFGCLKGSLTRLLFLICCKDDRSHLHVLTRLAQMLHHQEDVDELLAAESADELSEILRRLERSLAVPGGNNGSPTPDYV